MERLSELLQSLPKSLVDSFNDFIRDSQYSSRDIQQYIKEQFGEDFSIVEVAEWVKANISVSEKVKFLHRITQESEGLNVRQSLQYLFMRGIHLSILSMDRIELELPEDPAEVTKLLKTILQESVKIGKMLGELPDPNIRDIALGSAVETVELMEGNFRATPYEATYRESAMQALKVMEETK